MKQIQAQLPHHSHTDGAEGRTCDDKCTATVEFEEVCRRGDEPSQGEVAQALGETTAAARSAVLEDVALIENVLVKLPDVLSLLRCSRTCSHWRAVLDREHLWRLLLARHFPETSKVQGAIACRSLYLTLAGGPVLPGGLRPPLVTLQQRHVLSDYQFLVHLWRDDEPSSEMPMKTTLLSEVLPGGQLATVTEHPWHDQPVIAWRVELDASAFPSDNDESFSARMNRVADEQTWKLRLAAFRTSDQKRCLLMDGITFHKKGPSNTKGKPHVFKNPHLFGKCIERPELELTVHLYKRLNDCLTTVLPLPGREWLLELNVFDNAKEWFEQHVTPDTLLEHLNSLCSTAP